MSTVKSYEPQLGKLCGPEDKRDAIHVAVIPMTATRVLQPGEHMYHGIVDPYLVEPVQPGQEYWLLLYPKTITSLRHAWTHPAFDNESWHEPKVVEDGWKGK